MKNATRLAMAAIAVLALASTASAQTAVTSRSQLTTPETIDWNTVAPAFSAISNPVTVNLTSVSVTISTNGNPMNCQAGACWSGGFTNGDGLYFTRGGNVISMVFSQAVSGVATQAWYNYPQTSPISLFAWLAGVPTFSYTTTASGGGAPNNNQAGVIGILDAGGFDRLDIVAGGAPGEFSINQVDVQSTVTPEPASLTLMATGIVAVGVFRRRRKSAA